MTDKEVAKDVMKANPNTLASAVELSIADRDLLSTLKGPRKAASGTVHAVKEEMPSSPKAAESEDDSVLPQETKVCIRKFKAAAAKGETLCFGCGKHGHIKPNCPFFKAYQDNLANWRDDAEAFTSFMKWGK